MHSQETIRKIREAIKRRKDAGTYVHSWLGKHHSIETRNKLSKLHMGMRHTEETKLKMRLHEKTKEHLRKIGEARKKLRAEGKLVAWNKGKHYSEEHKKRLSDIHKRLFSEGKIIHPNLGKHLSDETIKKILAKIRKNKKPTKPEIKLNSILQKIFPCEWKYVGDGQIWIGNKNPDFMNCNGKKLLMEMYGDYWHKGETGEDRIQHFKKYGFDTLIVWEHELDNEANLLIKLDVFSKQAELRDRQKGNYSVPQEKYKQTEVVTCPKKL